jgi:starch synthase
MNQLPPLTIIHIATEIAPLAKVGGLGDVMLGLLKEFIRLGHKTKLILPHYDNLDLSTISTVDVLKENFLTFFEGSWHKNTISQIKIDEIPVILIDPHHKDAFFKRGTIYGEKDDARRFLYFARAAFDLLLTEEKVDIIHLHDWQVAAIAPLMAQKNQTLQKKIIYTIHNLAYQGVISSDQIESIGLLKTEMVKKEAMKDPQKRNHLNLMKGGITFSDEITTVSPTFAKEALSKKGGFGLDEVLKTHKKKFSGILNGIDNEFWCPSKDKYLSTPYNKSDLKGKYELQKELKKELQLSFSKRPLIGCIARLVPQKGLPLIKHAIEFIPKIGGQFVLLGSSPIESINEEFYRVKESMKNNPHVHLILNSQEEMAHLIFASSDMFIVPSSFEPCGLTQMIALKYGAIPIVRKTGGLADTVFDIDSQEVPEEKRNGFTFDTEKTKDFEEALLRALEHFKNKEKWERLVLKGMSLDLSWKNPAKKYISLYQKKRVVDKIIPL